jgi:hypothetical protein
VDYAQLTPAMKEVLHDLSPRKGKYLVVNSPAPLGLGIYLFPVAPENEALVAYLRYLHSVMEQNFRVMEDAITGLDELQLSLDGPEDGTRPTLEGVADLVGDAVILLDEPYSCFEEWQLENAEGATLQNLTGLDLMEDEDLEEYP